MTILLVDDDPSDAQLIRTVLTRQDPELTLINAETCEEARRIADHDGTMIDCIVMDERLKGTPGSECVKQLRAAQFVGAFGLLTGFPDTKPAVLAMQNGADFYLSKDDIQEGLLPSIRNAVSRRQDAIRAKEVADAKEKQYQDELRQLRDELDTTDPWLQAQRDIKNLTKSVAEVSTKVASIEGSTVQQFQMLVKMNTDWQAMLLKMQQTHTSLKVTRWKTVGTWILASIAAMEAVLLAYFAYLQATAK